MPFIPSAGELKTKPTQHSVKELRSIGIQPDILLCRTEREIPVEERRKLALFCNVREGAVIEARDVASIYDVPQAYHTAGLDKEVLAAFEIEPAPKPDMASFQWTKDAPSLRPMFVASGLTRLNFEIGVVWRIAENGLPDRAMKKC